MAGYEQLGIRCRSGGWVLVVMAFTTASNAGPATGGTTTVAISKPRLTKGLAGAGQPVHSEETATMYRRVARPSLPQMLSCSDGDKVVLSGDGANRLFLRGSQAQPRNRGKAGFLRPVGAFQDPEGHA